MIHDDFNSLLFTKKERRGLLILIFFMVGILIIWRVIPSSTPAPDEDFELSLSWEEFKLNSNAVSTPKTARSFSGEAKKEEKEKGEVNSFPFDPNIASEAELINLGLPLNTVKILINYRNKGGKFFKKEDLKNIFTLKDADYNRLEPFIKISKPLSNEKKQESSLKLQEKKSVNLLIELNTADADKLMKLYGIGPVYSKRILNYRDRLGGYLSVEQLKEIRGLPDSTFQKVSSFLTVDPHQINKIKINTVLEEDLANHPYIGKYMAKNIIKLRSDLKIFKEISDLKLVPLINDEKYRKIAPYLNLD